MKELIGKTSAVWLMSNLYLGEKIVGELSRSHILTYNGYKIGMFGLCEFEWLGLLNPTTIPE
jgi:2',3'-cyclic-nucleotide 2'-phosphodiesterase (5'-nucleotidase family)